MEVISNMWITPSYKIPELFLCSELHSPQCYSFLWSGLGSFVFLAFRECHGMTPPAHGEEEDSVRLLLTENPRTVLGCSWCQVHGISFEQFPRPLPVC